MLISNNNVKNIASLRVINPCYLLSFVKTSCPFFLILKTQNDNPLGRTSTQPSVNIEKEDEHHGNL